MHSFINVQGQVLHRVQGDARLFNYVDNLIAYIAKGQDLGHREGQHGSEELDPAWSQEFAPRTDLSTVNE